MLSSKGILKALVFILIAGWMFLLGVMVGRESSPVKFDTAEFQKRLGVIAGRVDNEKKKQGRIELKFYDVLEKPESGENNGPPPETLRADGGKNRVIPVKTSRKRRTYKKQDHQIAGIRAEDKNYTIQVAAYRNIKDAETRISLLEKKGFAGYKIKGVKNGVVWYRVRLGFFKTFDSASEMKKKLNRAGIKAFIIKRDKNEDIKG
jgi:cell division protein FtsN